KFQSNRKGSIRAGAHRGALPRSSRCPGVLPLATYIARDTGLAPRKRTMKLPWTSTSNDPKSRHLTVVLLIALLAAIGAGAYVLSTPAATQPATFTELNSLARSEAVERVTIEGEHVAVTVA